MEEDISEGNEGKLLQKAKFIIRNFERISWNSRSRNRAVGDRVESC